MTVEYVDVPRRGPMHLLRGMMTRDDEARLRAESCRALVLNDVPEGLDFLARIADLEELYLSDLTVEDVSGVNHLRNLRVLHLNSYDETAIDFRCFARLEECFTFWRPSIETLFAARQLQRLEIQRYDNDDLTPLNGLTGLHALKLVDPRIKSLQGIDAFPKLTSVTVIGGRRLDDVDGAADATNLEQLELSQCRLLIHIEPVRQLRRLREVVLNDCKRLESIAPLEACADLEEVVVAGSTNLTDGDLAFLTDLPRLKTVLIKNHRHYRPSVEEIRRTIAARS